MRNNYLKNILKNIYWNIYGITISNPILPENIKSILFICKGNICRSPFAEHFATIKYNAKNQYLFISAGIHVDIPKSPPIEAINAAKYFGVNVNDYKSMQINYNLLESSDMIMVMETWQYLYLQKMFKKFRNKIFLLPLFEIDTKKYMNKYYKYNIKDPYGKGLGEFIECYNRIERSLEGLFKNISKH